MAKTQFLYLLSLNNKYFLSLGSKTVGSESIYSPGGGGGLPFKKCFKASSLKKMPKHVQHVLYRFEPVQHVLYYVFQSSLDYQVSTQPAKGQDLQCTGGPTKN